MRLEGATIDGDFDCSGGTFFAPAFLPQIDGYANSSDELDTIKANGLKVGSDILFDTFEASGIISLIGAQVGGDFSCFGAKFIFPGEEPLAADGIVVGGTTFLDEVRTNGVLRFVQADLKQGFYVNRATFDTTGGCKHLTKDQSNTALEELGGPACGIYASDATIGGTFEWKQVKKLTEDALAHPERNPFWLFVPRSKVTNIDDDESSWLDRVEIVDCLYAQIQKLSDADEAWRLRQLDRHYAGLNVSHRWPDTAVNYNRACRWLANIFPLLRSVPGIKISSTEASNAVRQFKPQPYIQLARAFQAAGFEAAAQHVFLRLERNLTRYSDIGFFRRLWRYMLDGTLRYGYRPLFPVVIILGWAVFCSVIFQAGYDAKRIVAAKDGHMLAGDNLDWRDLRRAPDRRDQTRPVGASSPPTSTSKSPASSSAASVSVGKPRSLATYIVT